MFSFHEWKEHPTNWVPRMFLPSAIRGWNHKITCYSQMRTHSKTWLYGMLISDFQPPLQWKINVSCVQATQLMVLCFSSPHWLKQTGMQIGYTIFLNRNIVIVLTHKKRYVFNRITARYRLGTFLSQWHIWTNFRKRNLT